MPHTLVIGGTRGLGLGFLLALVPVAAMTSGDASLLNILWLAVPVYLLFSAGFLWSWVAPELELGQADALMVSTAILGWARLKLWWLGQKFRWRVWLLG